MKREAVQRRGLRMAILSIGLTACDIGPTGPIDLRFPDIGSQPVVARIVVEDEHDHACVLPGFSGTCFELGESVGLGVRDEETGQPLSDLCSVTGWSGDAPNVLAVTATGLVTALSVGGATITVDVHCLGSSRAATLTARVVPLGGLP